jgi:hypothetical protein
MDHSWRTQPDRIGVLLRNSLAAWRGRIVMRFYLFERQTDAYIRKSREYLEEAHVRRVEHQAAAEHHSALAKMYAARIVRIEAEVRDTLQVAPGGGLPLGDAGPPRNARLKSDSVVSYPSRASQT